MKGVSFDTRSNKYRAYISVGCERFYLGFFQTEAEAEQKRLEMQDHFYNESGLLDLTFMFSNEQLLTLYLKYAKDDKLRRNSFKKYVFINYKINAIVPPTSLSSLNLEPKYLYALSILINGNSIEKASNQIDTTKYHLMNALSQALNVSIPT